MKRKLLIQSGVTLVVLFVLAFGVSVKQAYATTGCFTDTIGNWAETFICWMKDNGITSGVTPTTYAPNANVTRAEMAVFIQRVANIPPSTGDIYINAGYNGWVPAAGTAGTIGYYSDWNELRGPAAGSYVFLLTPDLPVTLYGKQMYLAGVKICYTAVSATDYITAISMYHYLEDGSIYNSIVDNTDRTVAGCATINLPFAGAFFGGEHVSLVLTSTLSASGTVGIRSTTFILKPSATPGTLGPKDQLDTNAIDTSGASHQVP
jgi:hypothetical protein